MPLAATDRAGARALLRRHVDVARESGDGLRRVQDELGLGVVEAAELLWEAFVESGEPAIPGSIASRLADSDSPASFPYARPFPYEPDREAPVLPATDRLRMGRREIPRLGLGCMRLVSKGGVVGGTPASAIGIPHSPEANRHALLTAVDVCGIRYLDVSRAYGPWPGAGEGILRDWLWPYRDDLLIASKVGYAREPSGGWVVDLDPDYIGSEIAASHRQLGGRIPLLYLVARSTPTTPVIHRPASLARSFAPLVEAAREGLVEHLGVANVTVEELDELAELAPIAAVQNRFSFASLREPAERAVWDRCRERGIPFVAWGLFGEGVRPRPEPPRCVASAAIDLDVTPEELTLALLLAAAPHVVVLPGPGRRSTIYSSVHAAGIRLDPGLVSEIMREIGGD